MPVGIVGSSTRQAVGELFSRQQPLAAGETVTSKAFEVAGYAQVVVSVVADQPHLVVFEEANRPEGPWTPVSSINSAPVGTSQRAAGRLRPVGFYMRAKLQNLAGVAMTSLSAMVYGTAT